MDPIFEHPAFDSSKRQLQKPQKTFENSLYTCFKCVSNKVFFIAKQVKSADEGASVFKECRDCHNKWGDE